jgi:soluble lytic murein transglycosylase
MTRKRLLLLLGILINAAAFAVPGVTATATMLPPERPDSLTRAAAGAGTGDVTAALPTASKAAIAGLKSALGAVDKGKLADALSLASALPPLEQDIVSWIAIRRGLDGLTPGMITAFATRNPHWPNANIMRLRGEQALSKARLAPEAVVAAYANSAPVSEAGMFSLARAHIALGRQDLAGKALAKWWASTPLSPEEDAATLKQFGDFLGVDQHKARFEMLMYRDRVVQATALSKRIGPGYEALAAARTSVLRNARDSGKKLDAVPKAARKNPLYAFTLAEWHRRNDRAKNAAKALLSVNGDAPIDHGDEWWVERRIVSRDLIERGDARLAYKVAAAHRGGSTETLAEAHFHAGWYALRFLNEPDRAIPHFEALLKVASKPISRSRAAYWLGRAEEAAGRIEDARTHYSVAAADEVAFYGQLARVKLGHSKLGLPPLPMPTDVDKAAFAGNDLARVMVLLIAAGYEDDCALIYPELARQLPSGGQIKLLVDFIERRGDHQLALQIGKIAAERGLGVERLAYPLEAIPEDARDQKAIETAIVYAIARQESAFNPRAVSKAGAMGLLQLLPSTAAATAKNMGVSFSKGKLSSDPSYNAALGAAHLHDLVEEFNGSYILTFAAYNAGSRRAYDWIERFGDPRDPKVDPIDWIELIPFGETRNYVQRVTENLQVYRERLNGSKLGIAADLRRGG